VKKSSESIQWFLRSCTETKYCTDFTLKQCNANEAEFEKVVLVKVVLVNHSGLTFRLAETQALICTVHHSGLNFKLAETQALICTAGP
jgi:hypothetical protein